MNKLLGGRELARFQKNSGEDVRLTLQDFGVGRYLDIRVWAKVRPSDGTPSSPTEHGFALDVDLLPDLRRAIFRAMSELGGPWAGQEARPSAASPEIPGLHEDESGDPRPDGEKRGPQIDQDERTAEGEGQGRGPGGCVA